MLGSVVAANASVTGFLNGIELLIGTGRGGLDIFAAKSVGWLTAVLLLLSVVAGPAAAQQGPVPTPNFNREEQAFAALKDLRARIAGIAYSPAARGYAAQCDLAVREVEDVIVLYGAPDRDTLEGAWRTCMSVYEAVRGLTGG